MARYGLLNAVVPLKDLDAEVDRWVADVLACAPLSRRAIKAVVRATSHLPARDAYIEGAPELVDALNSDDADEGVRAFREKRAPVWTGK